MEQNVDIVVGRAFLANIVNLFGKAESKDPTLNPNCSEFEVNKYEISDFVLKRLVPLVGVRPFPLDELLLMVSVVCKFKPTHIFEWGTNIGVSTRIFYEAIRHFNLKTEVHSIDLPDDIQHIEHPHGQRGRMVRGKKGVYLHQGDGLDTSISLLSSMTGGASPLFFLDGDHDYRSVRRELEGVLLNFRSAPILLHDTFFQSVEANYNTGPHRAIQDVIGHNSKNFKILELNTGLPGMTLVYGVK